jgi:hypothetical protein
MARDPRHAGRNCLGWFRSSITNLLLDPQSTLDPKFSAPLPKVRATVCRPTVAFQRRPGTQDMLDEIVSAGLPLASPTFCWIHRALWIRSFQPLSLRSGRPFVSLQYPFKEGQGPKTCWTKLSRLVSLQHHQTYVGSTEHFGSEVFSPSP